MSEHSGEIVVVDNPEAHRFEALVNGQRAIAAYRRRGSIITFTHTEVPKELEGHGVASALARGALEQVKAEGLEVVPRCRFMAAYIARHPEYRALVRQEPAD